MVGPLVGAEMNRWMDWLIVVMKQRRGSKDETDKYIIGKEKRKCSCNVGIKSLLRKARSTLREHIVQT